MVRIILYLFAITHFKMQNYLLFWFVFLFSLSSFCQQFPSTKKTPSTFTKHTISYEDDYSWLEKMGSEEVNQWVATQNSFTDAELEKDKKAYNIAFKIKDYNSLSTNALPVQKGKYFYGIYRVDKSLPGVLFYRKNLNDTPTELVNPYKIYHDKNVLLMGYFPSQNNVYLGYEISPNGGDRHEIRFTSFAKSEKVTDILSNIKFSDIAWYKDSGLFYEKTSTQQTFASDSTYQLYYHKIGTNQTEDKLVFDATKNESSLRFFISENQLFITEYSKNENSKNIYSCSLANENFELEKFISNDKTGFRFLNYRNGRIYFSSKKFDWGEVRSFDIKNRADEKVVIPQIYTHLLDDTMFYDDYIICKYKTLGKYYLSIYDLSGKFIRKFDAPPGMDFTIRFFDSETKDLYVSFFSYVISFQNFKLNIATGEVRNFYNDYIRPKVTLFPLDYFETKAITYKGQDNKDIPITIIHKKDLELDGNNPTLLKAYGGFGSVSGPSYDTGLLYFLEKGGVFAFAEIRGGGEKGLKWHLDGKGLKKMNSFNDFIAAAEFLINEKYTSPNKLAITGTSNGGLVVGVAMTQRPELFKVAIPYVGVFDMARFDEYTVGKYHLDEYGNPENEAEYQSLLAYSPYQNIKEEVNYPITLIVTSENDDRVPPVHSYKFAAKLQNRTAQKNPIYLKTRSNAGHYGSVSNYESAVNDKVDFYSFLMYHLMQ